MQYTANNMFIKSTPNPHEPNLLLSVTRQQVGWDFISFQLRKLKAGQQWDFNTGENELVLVVLSGCYIVTTPKNAWAGLDRMSVFSSAAHTIYLPRRTELTVLAERSGEFAAAWVPTDQDHPERLLQPEDVMTTILGGDNATWQRNDLLPAGSPVHRLIVQEIYTPGGNWSSYPPYKHDHHQEDEQGNLIEADLEALHFYKVDMPEGYALQRVYTDKKSPLHQAGKPIEALIRAENNSVVLIPAGYHPLVSAPGYTTYTLKVLAGPSNNLAQQADPRYTWIKESYSTQDKRLPIY